MNTVTLVPEADEVQAVKILPAFRIQREQIFRLVNECDMRVVSSIPDTWVIDTGTQENWTLFLEICRNYSWIVITNPQ